MLDRIVDVGPAPLPFLVPTPVATDPPVNPDDAMPNDWEIQFHHDRRGRSTYVAWLEARASADEAGIEGSSMVALRRGWYLGKESFRDKLLGLMEKAKAGSRKKDSHADFDPPWFSPPRA